MPDGIEGAPEASTGTEAAPVSTETTSEVEGSTESTTPSTTALDIDSYGTHVVTIKVDGEELTVPLSEALSGYQRQADYTRKTQELAADRRSIEAYESLNAAFLADPKGTIEALARQAGVDLGGAAAPDVELDPEEARLAKIESFMADEQQRREQARLDGTLADLRSRYGEENVVESELIQYAVQRGFTIDTLDDAFKSLHYDKAIEKARADALATREAGEQSRQESKEVLPPVHGGSNNGGPVRQGDKPVGSIREAWALAKVQRDSKS